MSASTAQPQRRGLELASAPMHQSMSLRLGIAIASASSTPASIPMFTRLSRLTLSGATSSTPAAAAASVRSCFSVLPKCFSPRPIALGSAAGCTSGIAAARRLGADRGDRGRDGPVVARPSARSWRAARRRRGCASSRRRSPRRSRDRRSSTVPSSPTRMRSGSRSPWVIPAAWSEPSSAQTLATNGSVSSSPRIGQRPPARDVGHEQRGVRAGRARSSGPRGRGCRPSRRPSTCRRCARPAAAGSRTPGRPGPCTGAGGRASPRTGRRAGPARTRRPGSGRPRSRTASITVERGTSMSETAMVATSKPSSPSASWICVRRRTSAGSAEHHVHERPPAASPRNRPPIDVRRESGAEVHRRRARRTERGASRRAGAGGSGRARAR